MINVGEQTAKGDAHQQQGFKLFDNAQIQQHAGHADHDEVFPASVGKETREPRIQP